MIMIIAGVVSDFSFSIGHFLVAISGAIFPQPTSWIIHVSRPYYSIHYSQCKLHTDTSS